MHKFFTPKEYFQGNIAKIVGDDVKHIYKVLRLQQGEEVVINNLQGEEFNGKIDEVNKTEVLVEIISKIEETNESGLNITLFQGLPKAQKMDLIVQKGTELGVSKFIPVITGRVDVKLKGEFKKLDRLNRISLEAAKQSKRTILPKIEEPIQFSELISNIKDYDLILVPYENQTGLGIKGVINKIDKKNNIKNIGIVIGPEGGFEEEEIKSLEEHNAHIVTLGKRILRTETAGFTAVTLVQYELGDVGGEV